MGAGKTAIGKRLAASLGWNFVDIDHVIEEREKCSVADIFSAKGEPYFREKERCVMQEYVEKPTHIIAPGGGAFMQEEIRDLIKEHAVSVWIKADLEVLVERVSRKNTRPLLEQGDKREILQELIEQRYPIYAEADITVDTNVGPHEVVVERIAQALDQYYDKR